MIVVVVVVKYVGPQPQEQTRQKVLNLRIVFHDFNARVLKHALKRMI